MEFNLKKLSTNDGQEIYAMLQEIPYNENGFLNDMNGATLEEFQAWLIKRDNESKGIGIGEGRVPQDIYWLFANGFPVGYGKIRHRLTKKLLDDGGHIGYSILPSERGKDYGKLQLKLLLERAKEMGIDKVLLTIHINNINSLKAAMKNGGVIEKQDENKCWVWIEC
ncbi:GNAT family N-acetyltransferase [Gottfriedia sp. S16(2024)]|uniref:GNAT family N-acetyltransferase n=1 Tax=Gottfriedia sp. S16(2024) TaxID=3162883 RepID=UPI003D1A2CE9